jgi:hypothetical protein
MKVLIEVASDGFVKVYADKGAQVMMINRPHVTSLKGGVLADQLIDEALPFSWRAVYYPSNVRCAGLPSKLTVEKLAEKVDDQVWWKWLFDKTKYWHKNLVFRALKV